MERLIVLDKQPSVLSEILAEMRGVDSQKDMHRFRENLETIGLLMGYEISKSLEYSHHEVTTPLAVSEARSISNDIVICAILRAALPLQHGMAKALRKSELSFIAAARSPLSDGDFEITTGYMAQPDLTNKTLIIVDPMVATARSAIACYQKLTLRSKPKTSYFASVFSSQAGVANLGEALPQIVHYTCVVDKELNSKSYIVPGLGDAGDLAFGEKVNN